MASLPKFHQYLDIASQQEGMFLSERRADRVKHTITRELTLSYQFYTHFHPYVEELVKRLLEKSLRGLQATDTEYVSHVDGAGKPDGAWEPLPGSTVAILAGDTQVVLQSGSSITAGQGTPITLADGTAVELSSGKQAVIPGLLVLTEPRGLRLAIPGGVEDVAFETRIKLVNAALVALPNGSPATLPVGTELAVTSCKPKPRLHSGIFSDAHYDPSELVRQPYPVKDLDFTSSGAYSAYNWELFFHVPFSIAVQLSKNQRYAEAMRWLHLIFDPTDDSDGPTPERFWKVKPFQFTDAKLIEEILVNLSTHADPVLWQETVNSIAAWKDAPFRPHLVARYRHTAYMFKSVMAYLDNLIDWGDSLFRQDTGESINEATQLYVLAANILGPRPQAVPKKGSVRPQTYASLKKDLNEFGIAAVKLETDVPFDNLAQPDESGDLDQFTATLRSLGNALYFCVPRNDKLLGYWDTVADRLFKIRNSLNLLGIFRQLPLFEPPIDPALLARAAAAGLDVGAVVSGLNQPLPLVRFQVLVQKAAEICQEVKSLGNQLLSAIEKEDNEALAILRAKHERVILGLAETVRYGQWQESIKTRESLEKSILNAAHRYTYYERLLGKKDNEIKIPELEALDVSGLDKMKFKAGEPEMPAPDIPVDIAQDLGASGGKIISSYEARELHQLEEARGMQEAAAILDLLGKELSLLPQFGLKVQPVGAGGDVTFGGVQLSTMMSMMSSSVRLGADQMTYAAGNSAKIGGYARREQDWAFQSNLAAGEITQTLKQLRAAQIREAIAKREWENHQQQIKHAEDIEHFLAGEKNSSGHKKTTTQSFYTWMKREARGLHGQCFQFAFDIARKAERALQHELGDTGLSYLQFGYLGGREGLLAGEKLYLDIKRMELAYHELNQREYELTKHVSLLQVNSQALLDLRVTGRCTVFLPEELFDMDGPGHYFRRIKTVAVSVPCVTGPYTSINCTLILLKSSIRRNSLVGEDGYARAGAEDGRFNDHFGSMQSIVTSTGQNDSGLFETNLRDERYLPFEGSGAVSEWQLELPATVRQFNYNTISDVILHLRYTAREGGGLLRNGAVENLEKKIAAAEAAGSVRLFSLRHEFPSEWAKFTQVALGGATTTAPLAFDLRPEHFPFWSRGRLAAFRRVEALAQNVEGKIKITDAATAANSDTLEKVPNGFAKGLITKTLPALDTQGPLLSKFRWMLDENQMDDLWLAISWGAAAELNS